MKFRTYLETIENVSVYPMISLFLFAAVFAFVLYSTFRIRKSDIEEKSNLPLEQ